MREWATLSALISLCCPHTLFASCATPCNPDHLLLTLRPPSGPARRAGGKCHRLPVPPRPLLPAAANPSRSAASPSSTSMSGCGCREACRQLEACSRGRRRSSSSTSSRSLPRRVGALRRGLQAGAKTHCRCRCAHCPLITAPITAPLPAATAASRESRQLQAGAPMKHGSPSKPHPPGRTSSSGGSGLPPSSGAGGGSGSQDTKDLELASEDERLLADMQSLTPRTRAAWQQRQHTATEVRDPSRQLPPLAAATRPAPPAAARRRANNACRSPPPPCCSRYSAATSRGAS